MTLVDNPNRYISRGGAAEGNVLLGGRAGTDSPWELDLGVGRPGDKITFVLFVRVLLSSGFLMNTIYGLALTGDIWEQGLAKTNWCWQGCGN